MPMLYLIDPLWQALKVEQLHLNACTWLCALLLDRLLFSLDSGKCDWGVTTAGVCSYLFQLQLTPDTPDFGGQGAYHDVAYLVTITWILGIDPEVLIGTPADISSTQVACRAPLRANCLVSECRTRDAQFGTEPYPHSFIRGGWRTLCACCLTALLPYYNLDNLGELANKKVINFENGRRFTLGGEIADLVFDSIVFVPLLLY